MRKLATELSALVRENSFLQRGLRENLFNSAALARFIRPQLAARLKKPVSTSAISMALSRLASDARSDATLDAGAVSDRRSEFAATDIGVRVNLELVSYTQSGAVRQELEKVYRKLQRRELFATLTEGVREVTLIFERSDQNPDFSTLGTPLVRQKGVGCIAIYFPKKYGTTPGFLYTVFQQLYFQNINVIEIASTSRELLVYLAEADLQLGFDTLFERFVSRPS